MAYDDRQLFLLGRALMSKNALRDENERLRVENAALLDRAHEAERLYNGLLTAHQATTREQMNAFDEKTERLIDKLMAENERLKKQRVLTPEVARALLDVRVSTSAKKEAAQLWLAALVSAYYAALSDDDLRAILVNPDDGIIAEGER